MLEITNSTTSLEAQPYCGLKAGFGRCACALLPSQHFSGAKSATDWVFIIVVDYWTPL